MTARLLAALRSPAVRWGFLVAALGGAVWTVVEYRHDLAAAAGELSPGRLLVALAVSAAYIACTFVAWRRVLADLGSRLPLGAAAGVFGVSQVGKYVPGGVWNVVAAAELGAAHHVPRQRSLAAMAVSVLIAVVSGCAVGATSLPFLATDSLGPWRAVLWAAPLVLVLLVPAVLNRVVDVVFRLARRPPLEHPLTWRGLGVATAWSVAGWLLAGLQVWLLVTALGVPATPRTVALSVGGYAAAWVVGFLAVLAPAGAGVREVVLAAVLGAGAAGALPTHAAALTVLVSRVLLTVVDLAFAAAGAAVARRSRVSRTVGSVP